MQHAFFAFAILDTKRYCSQKIGTGLCILEDNFSPVYIIMVPQHHVFYLQDCNIEFTDKFIMNVDPEKMFFIARNGIYGT